MDFTRTATALALTFSVPAIAMIQPGYRSAGSAPLSSQTRTTTAGAKIEASRVSQEPVGQANPQMGPRVQPAAGAFGAEMQRLSDEADAVDRLWLAYGEQCGGKTQTARFDFGREWFSVLDGTVEESSRTPDCVDLWQLIKQSGEGIRKDVRRTIAAARRARVDAGTEVGLLRWHSLEFR